MRSEGIETLPLYPEKRKCRFPTSRRVLEIFATHRKSVLLNKQEKIETFFDKLDPLLRARRDLRRLDGARRIRDVDFTKAKLLEPAAGSRSADGDFHVFVCLLKLLGYGLADRKDRARPIELHEHAPRRRSRPGP